MNFKQLEAFQAIMASGSTTGAAQRLDLSQSAVSRLLAQFEEDLGLRLFVREKGRLVPTNEAQALLQDAQGLVDSAQCFRRHSEQLRLGGFNRPLLKVAVPGTLSQQLMPSVVASFVRQHPGVVLEVLSGSYSDAERAVLSREADMGLVRLPVEMAGLKATACLESEAVCIMPRGHPLEKLETVGVLDLIDVSLILLGRQRLIRHEIDMAFRQARVLPRVAAEVHSVGVACGFVAQGLGVSIVNALLASYCRDMNFVSRPFRPRIAYQLGIASLEKAPLSALGDAFSQHLIDAIMAAVRPEDCTRRI
ncbi:LysR family transcriptional regulator [Polaromonas jejuensis]|uniref:LysR family transcriptional regulator n=1 Tax=Polaromonas jejuensis TaxID=457502 RepID=A0ABW0Q736_9BURK|nr:LysR family transcriptional regulator [Polaromonas jejuensis]